MSTADRIDVHQHLLPDVYVAALQAHGFDVPGWSPDWPLPRWSPEGALAMMDEQEIATGVLSLSTPGVHFGAADFGKHTEARELAARVNEAHADLVRDRPDRFGMFAAVPLPDVDGALLAITQAFDDLGADGVVLLANAHGTYLGDPALDPVMAELNRRRAVVLIHPGQLAAKPAKGVHPAFADFLLDTTRAAISLVLNKVPRRYPDIRMILSHAGGFVPYAAYRIANLTGANPLSPTGSTQDEVLEGLADFYFDTALSASPTSLPSLTTFAKPDHIVFGSDWPYAPESTVAYFTQNLDHEAGLDADQHEAINRSNALQLMPRLKHGSRPG